MMNINEIRKKKIKDMTYKELVVVKQDCICKINSSNNAFTRLQERKYLDKIIKRIREIENGI